MTGTGRTSRQRLTTDDLERLLDALEDSSLSSGERQALIQQLWRARRRMPGVLAERLGSGRSRLPGLAFLLLLGFAGENAKRYLGMVSRDPRAPDVVRLGARRRMGPPEGGAAERRAFLDTLRAPKEGLLEALGQATTGAFPDCEVLSETVENVLALDQPDRLEVLERSVELYGRAAAFFLRGLLHAPDAETQRSALQALVRIGDRGASRAIEHFLPLARDPDLVAEGRAALARFRLRLVRPEGELASAWPPLDRALVSGIDGSGSQFMIGVRRYSDEAFLVASVSWQDTWGARDVIGVMLANPDQLDAVLSIPALAEIPVLPVDLETVQRILAAALATNGERGNPIPPVVEVWEPVFHDDPLEAEPAGGPPELDDAPYSDRKDLLEESPALFMKDAFLSWGFDLEQISPYLPSGRSRRRRNEGLEATVTRILEGLVTVEFLSTLRRRLRRQAWILHGLGKEEDSQLALAAAAFMAEPWPVPPAEHPLLRAMVEKSLVIAYHLIK